MRITLILLLLIILIPQGCGHDDVDEALELISEHCGSDESERDPACEQITNAVYSKISSCEIAIIPVDVCELNCVEKEYKDGSYCHGTNTVDACIAAINTVPCDAITAETFKAIAECSGLFYEMAQDCIDYDEWEADLEDDDHHDWD